MGKLVIQGQNRLEGKLSVHGSKNSVLPILAATVVGRGQSVIENCPDLSDTAAACDILRQLGCNVWLENGAAIVENGGYGSNKIPEKLMRKMRSSVMFLGAILSREGSAVISLPGGCELGPRPIDLHISALSQMGVKFKEEGGYLYCTCPRGLQGAEVTLSIPSVGATENVMLAAVCAKGDTVIINAAREPEIEDLANFLNKMGAKISGAGSDSMRISGVSALHGTCHTIIPDRIVATTYILGAVMAGGHCRIEGINTRHMSSVLAELKEMDIPLKIEDDSVTVKSEKRPRAPKLIRTAYYPGFPTDAQALMMALASICNGSSMFIETVFQSRYKHVGELARMGANIHVEQRVAVVDGVERLWGANVEATDLRGGAALVLAGLAAEGETSVTALHHIDRAYEAFEEALAGAGAVIRREDGTV